MIETLGRRRWAIAGGHIPLQSIGHEPECTSRDELSVLNTSAESASLELTLFYSDREPVGPYELAVPAQRVKAIRFNDLIDPEAIPLGIPYACVIVANVPVIVQFGRFDSSQGPISIAFMMAYAE